MNRNALTHLFDHIEIDIQLPPDFPQQYREAVVKAADLCAVKKNMVEPPVFDVHASIAEPIA
jgi:ribosomal protein S12 methylthiotransferase accessory factor